MAVRILKEELGERLFAIGVSSSDPESGPSGDDWSLSFAFHASSVEEAQRLLDEYELLDPIEPENNEPNDFYDERDRYNAMHRSERGYRRSYFLATDPGAIMDEIESYGLTVMQTNDPQEWFNEMRDHGVNFYESYDLEWEEFGAPGKSKSKKQKSFKSEEEMKKFISELKKNDNFWKILSRKKTLREGARREDIIGEIARRYEDNDGSEDIEEFFAQRGIEGDLQDSDIRVHLRKLSSKDLGELMGLLSYEEVQVSDTYDVRINYEIPGKGYNKSIYSVKNPDIVGALKDLLDEIDSKLLGAVLIELEIKTGRVYESKSPRGKKLKEGIGFLSISNDRLSAFSDTGAVEVEYEEDLLPAVLSQIYGLEDGEDYQIGNGLEVLIRDPSNTAWSRVRKELGESKTLKGKKLKEGDDLAGFK